MKAPATMETTKATPATEGANTTTAPALHTGTAKVGRWGRYPTSAETTALPAVLTPIG